MEELKTKLKLGNPRQKKFVKGLIQRELTGKGTLDKIYLASGYVAKNNDIARANASRLANTPKIIKKVESFKDKLNQLATPEEVAKKLAEHIFSEDKRVSGENIERWIKINGNYAEARLRIGNLDEIADVLTEAEAAEYTKKLDNVILQSTEDVGATTNEDS